MNELKAKILAAIHAHCDGPADLAADAVLAVLREQDPVAITCASHIAGEIGYCAFHVDAAFETDLYAAPVPPAEPERWHVCDSQFEDWYQSYDPARKGDKQRAREAYAAGMGERKPVAPEDWTQAAGTALSAWLYQNDPDGIDWCDARNIDALLSVIPAPQAEPVVPEGWSLHPQDDGTMFLVTPHGNGLVARTGDNPASEVLHALASALIAAAPKGGK